MDQTGPTKNSDSKPFTWQAYKDSFEEQKGQSSDADLVCHLRQTAAEDSNAGEFKVDVDEDR